MSSTSSPTTNEVRGANLRAMIEQVAKLLVDSPAQVEVDEFDDRGTIVYELIVDPADLGKIIGKGGRTAKALRSLVEAAGEKLGQRSTLDIIDTDEEDDDDLAPADDADDDNRGNRG